MTNSRGIDPPRLGFLSESDNDKWPKIAKGYLTRMIPVMEKRYNIKLQDAEDHLQQLYVTLSVSSSATVFQYQGWPQFLSYVRRFCKSRVIDDWRKRVREQRLRRDPTFSLRILPPFVSEADSLIFQKEAFLLVQRRLNEVPSATRRKKLLAHVGGILESLGTLVSAEADTAERDVFLALSQWRSGPRKFRWKWNYRLCARALGVPERSMYRICDAIDAFVGRMVLGGMPGLMGSVVADSPNQ